MFIVSRDNLTEENGRTIMLQRIASEFNLASSLNCAVEEIGLRSTLAFMQESRDREVIISNNRYLILIIIYARILGKKTLVFRNDSKLFQCIGHIGIGYKTKSLRRVLDYIFRIPYALLTDVLVSLLGDIVFVQTPKELTRFLFDRKIRVLRNGVEIPETKEKSQENILILANTKGPRGYELDLFYRKFYDNRFEFMGLGFDEDCCHYGNVKALSRVPKFAEECAKYKVIIVPTYHGSGFINRIAQATASGGKVVTTEIARDTFKNTPYIRNIYTSISDALTTPYVSMDLDELSWTYFSKEFKKYV